MTERESLYPGPGMIADYHSWMDNAHHGDILIYHVGDLQYDRQAVYDENDPAQKVAWGNTILLNAVADSIAYEQRMGKVSLTQRRIDESVYEYRATRLRPDRVRAEQANKQSDAARFPI